MVGSSPRGRGKRCPATAIRRDRRLIPAWAGKTAVGPVRGVGCQAHPRVGGENALRNLSEDDSGGSSPRGRGKQHAQITLQEFQRLIPAWAGKTAWRGQGDVRPEAHPRVGGENGWWASDDNTRRGSSPRGRGKLTLRPAAAGRRRLIPAWAGKTAPVTDRRPRWGAHPPRGRGKLR